MRAFLASAFLLLLLVGPCGAAHQPRVLLLSAYHPGFPSFFDQVEGVRQALSGHDVELDVEFMDTKRFYDPVNFDRFTRLLTYKLAHTDPYDVLIVADDNALTYAVEHRDSLFKGIPVVFMAINNVEFAREQARTNGVTGVLEVPSMGETVDLIHRLKPELGRVVAVADATPSGRADLARFKQLMRDRGKGDYAVLDLGSMTWDEFPTALMAVDPADAILLLAAYRDKNGRTRDFEDSIRLMADNARCPIFHLWSHGIGDGAVGGKVISFRAQGRLAGGLALRILGGVSPASLPVVEGGDANVFLFDWPALRRFGFRESALPEGSVVLNRAASFLGTHRTILVQAGAVILVLVAVITYLLRLNRARAEAERRAVESERRYRAYIEGAPDAVMICDSRSTLIEANPAIARLTGYEPEELIGRPLISVLVPPKARPGVVRGFIELKRTGSFSGGLRMVRKDGSDAYVYLDIVRLGPDAFIGFCKDLTTEKATLEALAESEELFRGLLSQAGDAVFVFDRNGGFQFVNEAACLSLGYAQAELMDLGFAEVDPQAAVHLDPNRPWPSDTLGFESVHRRRDGSVFPVDIRLGRIRVSHEILYLALCRDISGRRENERVLLRESRINLAQAEIVRALTAPDSTIENIAAAAYRWTLRVTGAHHVYVGSVEPPDGALFLYNRDEMQKTLCALDRRVVVFHRGDGGYPGLWGHSLNTGTAFYTNQAASHPMAAGLPEGHVPVDQFLSVPCHFEGKLVGQICAANPGRDFTDEDLQAVEVLAGLFALAVCRKRAETELVAAKDAAEAASRAKSEFLANVSHELRTPLNGMFGMLQLVRGESLSAEQAEWIDTALTSGRNLLQVINDVLDLSKVEAGKIELVEAAFSLRGLIDSVSSMFLVQAREKGITLDWAVDNALGDAFVGDQGRIRQVLFNVVGNALKFTERGSIAIACRAAGPDLGDAPDAAPEDSLLLLFTVSDTGIGIPEDKISLIFNAFEQVDGSYARRYQGAGLGLGIVKRFVELMGGSVTVRSEKGKGTTVSFSVRVTRSAGVHEAEDVDSMSAKALGRLRLLLAEDDRVNQLAARKLLEREGFEVDVVGNGEDTIAALKRTRYDCILMDIQMPSMDGLEATRIIRADESLGDRRQVPIIALTAHAMVGDRERFIQAGMDDYLSKPMEVDALRALLARVVP
jgi:PAS domain S-box-containing protein